MTTINESAWKANDCNNPSCAAAFRTLLETNEMLSAENMRLAITVERLRSALQEVRICLEDEGTIGMRVDRSREALKIARAAIEQAKRGEGR